MIRHRSTAFIGTAVPRLDISHTSVTPQFRFVIRLAHACHAKGVAYDMAWAIVDGRMAATITVTAPAIPKALPLPKPAKEKLVAAWKPAIWDAEYRLDAWEGQGKKQPGFVIAHASGLALVKPSSDGEWGSDDADIREGWRVTHMASGRGFGLELTFKRAVDALMLAAAQPVDWTQEMAELARDGSARRAHDVVLAQYGDRHEKQFAKYRLEKAA